MKCKKKKDKEKVTPATLELSYLVCVDVSGPIASAAVVTSEITQEPPGQARQIPLIEGNIQFGPFASWARQALQTVWTRSSVKTRNSNRITAELMLTYRHPAPEVVSGRGSAVEAPRWQPPALFSLYLWISTEEHRGTIRTRSKNWALGGFTAPFLIGLWALGWGEGARGN